MVPRAHLSHHPKGIVISSAVFVWVPHAMLYNALWMWKKTPKITLSPWDFVNLLEKDRATAIGNTHKNLAKIAHVVWEICSQADRQTYTDMLITILCHRSRGWSKHKQVCKVIRKLDNTHWCNEKQIDYYETEMKAILYWIITCSWTK